MCEKVQIVEILFRCLVSFNNKLYEIDESVDCVFLGTFFVVVFQQGLFRIAGSALKLKKLRVSIF